jgi:uncharacterized repeat protein (TIGR01451 family)
VRSKLFQLDELETRTLLAFSPLTAPPISAVEGATIGTNTLIARFSNTTRPSDTYVGTIDFGDGPGGGSGGPTPANIIPELNNPGVFDVFSQLAHVYVEEGTYNVAVTVTDIITSNPADGGVTTNQANVADAPLNNGAAANIAGLKGLTDTFTVANFTDTDPNGTLGEYVATINWGDGSPVTSGKIVANLSGGGFSVQGTHQYTAGIPASANVHATVTITDTEGVTPPVGARAQLVVNPTVVVTDATIIVNTTSDENTQGSDSTLSLREAIEINNGTVPLSALSAGERAQVIANANSLPLANLIAFAIPGGPAPFNINVLSALPVISVPVDLDGTTQPGFSTTTNTPVVAVIGPAGGGIGNLLEIGGPGASGSTIRALSVLRAVDPGAAGIAIEGGATNNLIVGNYIGVSPGGTALGNTIGVEIFDASGNRIGGQNASDRNIISGNKTGVLVTGNGALPSSNILIEGNFIGTDPTGMTALPNTQDGIDILQSGNTVGGTTSGARNIISGNGFDGIEITDSQATHNVVEGNYVGTDVTGGNKLGNTNIGIAINATNSTSNLTGTNNTIGGTASGAGNVISGNGAMGLVIFAPNGGGSGNLVQGNFIGTDPSGLHPLGNMTDGIVISGAPGNTVGGTSTAARNIISANGKFGIDIENIGTSTATGNLVEGNFVGTDATGSVALGNANVGVNIQNGASANTIGGTATGAGNIIAGNLLSGIIIQSASPGNLVQGNFIGTDPNGDTGLGNQDFGVLVLGASTGNTIGGTSSAAANVIASNRNDGVMLRDAGTTGNLVAGNFIGTDASSHTGLGNKNNGIKILNASNNTVGGTVSGARNVISGNTGVGVLIFSDGTAPAANNLVAGNFIGTDANGAVALPNMSFGVEIDNAANNTIGAVAPALPNVISGNKFDGIIIQGTVSGPQPTTNNLVQNNFIGTDASGTKALGNLEDGIAIVDAASTTIGGTVSGTSNVISANTGTGAPNTGSGVSVQGPSSLNNLIAGNFIGTDLTGATGTDSAGNSLGNKMAGVLVSGALHTTIGGTTTAARNVLSNNGLGIHLGPDGITENTLVEGNFIGTDATGKTALGNSEGIRIDNSFGNTIGGLAPIGGPVTAPGNLISGNKAEGIFLSGGGTATNPGNNVIEGNYIGTEVNGLDALGNGLSGVSLLSSAGNTIGGTASGAGNLLSGNGNGTSNGIALAGAATTNTVIQGNIIGPNRTGTAPLASGSSHSNNIGIAINDAENNTIGGVATGARNIIAFTGGNSGFSIGSGIYLFTSTAGAGTGNIIEGNTISSNGSNGVLAQLGSAAQLSPLIAGNTIQNNGFNGVYLINVNGATIGGLSSPGTTTGGTVTAAGNLISNNGNDGVKVDGGAGDSILSNTIFSDASGLEIELLRGANGGLAAPVLTTATTSGGNTTISGTLSAVASTPYIIQFFSSPAANAPGFGEGETFLGQTPTNVVTDATGHASFTVTLPGTVATNQFLTATATDVAPGNTSMFSKAGPDLAVTVTALPQPVNQTQNLTYTVTVTDQGANPALGVTLTDTLPGGVTFISATGGVTPTNGILTFPVGDLNRGASAVFTIVVRVDTVAPDSAGTITNTASATTQTAAQNPDVNPANNTVMTSSTVTLVADLSLSDTASPEPVNQTQDLTYTLTVTNLGPSPAQGFTITDTLPAGVTFVSATGGVTPVGRMLTFASLNPLASGAMATYTIVVTADTAGSITDQASVTSTTTDLNLQNNTASATSTVTPVADLSVSATAAPEPVNQTANLTYTLTVTNHGPSPAQGYTLTDTLPAGVTFVSATGGVTPVNGTLTFTSLSPLASGAMATYTIVVTANTAGSITDNASVTSSTTDLNLQNNTASATSTVKPVADLSVSATAAPEPVDQTTNLTYTLTVTNHGPSPAQGYTLTDTLPAGVTFVSATGGVTPVGRVLTFTSLNPLASGAMATYTIVVTANTAGSITDNASVTSSTTDLNLQNNTASATSTVTPVADLSVSATAAPEPVDQTTNLTYTLTVTNHGPSPAQGYTLTDTLPAGVTFVSATGGETPVGGILTFASLNPLASGAMATYTIVVTADTAGSITDQASVTSTTTDLNLQNNTASATSTVTPVADLAVTGTATPNPVDQTQNLTYTVTVTNNGPSPAGGVTLTDTLPQGVTFVSATGGVVPSNGVLTFNLGTVNPLVTATAVATIFGGSTGTIGSVTGITVTNPGSGYTTAPTVTLTGGGATVPATAIATVANGSVTGITITDGGMGYTSDPTVTIAAPPPPSAPVTIVVRADTAGLITDTAHVTSTTTDLVPGNNSTSIPATVTPVADLAITGTATPEPVDQGSNLTYTLTVTNNGPSAAAGVTVIDTLPAGVTFVSATNGVTPVGNTLTFNNVGVQGIILPGDTATLMIVVRADTTGTITDTASVSSQTKDLVPGNNSTTITSTGVGADLAVTETADQSSIVQFQNLTYTITVTNNGPSAAAGVTLTDTLPDAATFVSATGGITPTGNTLNFNNLGTLAAGATQTFTVVIQPNKVGDNVNTVSVSSTTFDPTAANNTQMLITTVTPSFTVTNVNNGGPGSLRQVIMNVNSLAASARPATVLFKIPGPGPLVIRLQSALPSIKHPAVIDAISPATSMLAAPLAIDGSLLAAGATPQSQADVPGLLDVAATGVTIRGLTIQGYDGFGIKLDANSGSDKILGDTIVTNPGGNVVPLASGAGGSAIVLLGGILVTSAGNTIGDSMAQDPNVISGDGTGVYLYSAQATGNIVTSNHIGTPGSNPLVVDGIDIDGASSNTVGGTASGAGNTIEGYQAGIYLFDSASNNVIEGNTIQQNGVSTPSNGGQELGGILVSGANNNQIGTASAGNQIINNQGSGIILFNDTTGTTIAANTISGNSSTGVYIRGASGNSVGINGAGNTISGNTLSGVDIEGSAASRNTVLANLIQRNGENGVYIFKAPQTTVGGTTAGDGNTIQSNGFSGVDIEGSTATGNVVQGNTITDQTTGYGVLLQNGATGNTIGGGGSAANAFRNNALGNVQVLNGALPPSGDPTGGNTIGGNTTLAPATSLSPSVLKKHLHKLVRHPKKHPNHPVGPKHLNKLKK